MSDILSAYSRSFCVTAEPPSTGKLEGSREVDAMKSQGGHIPSLSKKTKGKVRVWQCNHRQKSNSLRVSFSQ